MALSDIKINSSFFKFLDERVAVSSLLSVVAAGAISAILMFLLGSNFSSIEERAGALPWLAAPDTAQEERITIVSVDERSLAEFGPWPWSWDLIAELVDKINSITSENIINAATNHLNNPSLSMTGPENTLKDLSLLWHSLNR